MFSSTAVAPVSTALRNPRRRQRTGSAESVATRQQPKRLKRSGITSGTFDPPTNTLTNGYHHGHEALPEPNGFLENGADYASLAIRPRGSKRPDRERRANRNDGNVELTKNDIYTVARLASTPFPLQEQQSLSTWHGTFTPSMGYAVATTHTQAFVWRYSQGTQVASTSKPVTVRLFHPDTSGNGSLPLGILVPSSPEPGLLIVMPVSSKVVYWESLSAAASVDLERQKQQSTQGTVAGISPGELIVKITEAEPQGFLLTVSSGKVVHLTITEHQGKPSISTQFLRSNNAQAGGIFGSLKNIFAGVGWLKDIVAVKVGDSAQRGSRECVITTTAGLIQLWNLDWNGAHSLRYEVDVKMKLLESLLDTGTFPRNGMNQSFKVLDIAFLPAVVTGQEVTSSSSRSISRLLVLTTIANADTSRYNLHVIDIADNTVNVPIVHSITCYTTPTSSMFNSKPELLVPDPGQTAYIIFDNSVVLASLEEIEESPDSQLRTEARRVPDPFQDVLDFRKDRDFQVVGYAADTLEKGQRGSSCTIMVRGYGAIRVSVALMKQGLTSEDRTTITAETKLEQAVFYGAQQSLLDFTGRREIQFADEDVQDAALRISRAITDSSSKHLPAAGPNMEQQLHRRAIALADLIKHLRKHYQPLDMVTRWKLLWEAEKMAAARALWRLYNAVSSNQMEQEKILLCELVELIHEDDKLENKEEDFETDAVRHWFVHDIWRLEMLVPWATKALLTLYDESVEDDQAMSSPYRARLLSQACDIQLMALETAFVFRQNNAALYGIADNMLVEGLLSQQYERLPEIWTSTSLICGAVQELALYTQENLFEMGESGSSDEEGNVASDLQLKEIAEDDARLVNITSKTHLERSRWLRAQDEAVLQRQGRDLEQSLGDLRRKMLKGLVNIGQYAAAIILGEKYEDMEALAEVLEVEIQSSQEELSQVSLPAEERQEIHAKIAICEGYVDKYFDRYGAAWADAFFARFVAQGRLSSLLVHGPKQRRYLTKFLRKYPECCSFSWMNEVSIEGDYATAADDLGVAQKQAETVWAKKMQLSMSKLAHIAAVGKQQGPSNEAKVAIQSINRSLEILAAQQELHDYLHEVFHEALNETDMRTKFVMEQYGKRFVNAKPALQNAMRHHIARVVEEKALEPEDLIDTISLMDEDGLEPDSDYAVGRFLTAIKLIRLSTFEAGEIARKGLLERIIWRRCIIQDNWAKINRTEFKDDSQVEEETKATALFKTLREGFKIGFWDDNPPLEPAVLRAAGTTVDSLRVSSRYNNASDSELSELADDLEIEDGILETCIEEGRLEQWWTGIVDAARMSARNEADQDGEERSQRDAAEREFREQMRRNDRAAWGLEERVNERLDEEGDVMMGI
ncbi:MAG: hypothetical protein Q9220_004200 [cf. Caloplaca sp. 1 TL-2023]